jgi:hypothetical protein
MSTRVLSVGQVVRDDRHKATFHRQLGSVGIGMEIVVMFESLLLRVARTHGHRILY